MNFLIIIIKIIIILAMILFMALPFIAEFLSFYRDNNRKITYKRFRIVVYTAIYVFVVTVVLCFIKELIFWLESLPFVQRIAARLALSHRTVYFGKVFIAILINFAIGVAYVLFSKFVRIGISKKKRRKSKADYDESIWKQDIERQVIRFFYTETWFFVGNVLKWLSVFLSVLYALSFVAYLLPAMFASDWIPYSFISMLFSAGYIYPVISLLALWEMYFFLEGIKRIEIECPELLIEDAHETKKIAVDLKAIDDEVRKQFGDFYICDVDVSAAVQQELASTTHSSSTECITQAVENDQRNPQPRKEAYLNCLDCLIESDKGVLINGNFFSEFSMSFLRYVSAVLARGDNVVFVCNSDFQIDAVYEHLVQGLSEISSLYCKGFNKDAIDYNDPIWRVIKISGERSVIEEALVDDNNVLVTSLSYLCSTRFGSEHKKFVSQIDTVVFVDALNTVNMYNRQLAILNTRLKHITKQNSIEAQNGNASDAFRVRYVSRKIRYICFDDTRTPGLDKVVKNLLAVEFDTVDAMSYSASTIVRCYRYEGVIDKEGRRLCPQFFNSEEEVGAVMNMAVLCLAKGASNVTVFTDNIIPYGNIAETITSNMGQLSIKADGSNIRLNKQFYNPDDYSVIIAMDSGNNLPKTLRRYISMMPDKPTLIIVFSRPYLLRDYYISNINSLWSSAQIERIPVEEGTKRDVAQRILVKANAGGISKDEVFRLAAKVPQFSEYVSNRDINAVLREVLQVYGMAQDDRLYLFKYFEYTLSQDFDETGKCNSEVRIVLRRQGKLFDMVNARDMVTMVVGDSEIVLPMPRNRLTQNYIARQNMIHNGNIYYIYKVDVGEGKIYTRLAVEGKNKEVYQYIQAREYYLDVNKDKVEYAVTKHIVLKGELDNVGVSDVFVSAFKAPMEVVTNGYYDVDPHTLATNAGSDAYHSINDPGNDELAKQTYRRYGDVTSPVYSFETVSKATNPKAEQSGAQVMAVRLCGQFGSDVNKTLALAAVMLNELLQSMFPSVADSIAVCPVFHEQMTDEDAQSVLQKTPKIKISGENELISTTDFTLLIIEDCATDLGVISVLMSAGDNVLHTLFNPIFNYLNWYLTADQKSDYLCFGLDHEPTCFDFASLHKLSKLLGDDKHDMNFVDLESVVEYARCDFCGKRYAKGDDIVELEDGRRMCKTCAENLVGNNKKALKAHMERVKMFLESTYGITLDDDYEFCFESTLALANTLKQNHNLAKRGADIPLKSYVSDKTVHVEYSIPSVNLLELLVREMTHVWQLKHLPELAEDLAEGHIALVAVQYLRYLNQKGLASVRTTYYESTDNISGEGYRKLVKALLENPQYGNNPFRYLIQITDGSSEEVVIPPTPRVIEASEYGLPYTPEQPDRARDGELKYFYYERLTASCQKLYNVLLAAIRNHEEQVTVEGFTKDDVDKVSYAIAYDHPELFWYKWSILGNTSVHVRYGASAEEAAVLQKRIDEVVPKYLEGIDDSMSAYDVALRIHAKVISMVDYDTIALNKQKQEGGPAMDKIDYLRTICGALLNGSAVCAGYARAMQYLLQKCGIECAELVGYTRKASGEKDTPHAWNIVKIDGDYYQLDTTWDDSSNTVQAVKNNDLGFDYFCITTEEMTRTRYIDLCPVDVPICDATRCNYFNHNDYVLDTYDLEKIKVIAQTAAKNKSKAFSFKCKDRALLEQCLSRLFMPGLDPQTLKYKNADCEEVIKAASKIDKQILSTKSSYTYDPNIWTVMVRFAYK